MKTLHTLICAISAALILSACSPHNSSDKPATAPIVPVNLIDSIHDPFLRKGIPADSIEMMEVKRVVCGDLPVEHIVYIDHRISENIRYFKSLEQETRNYADQVREMNSDSDAHALNPFPELNDIYSRVFLFHGKLIFPGGMDEGIVPTVISDSMVYDMGQLMFCYPYVSGQRQPDNTIVYIFNQKHGYHSQLEIKKLGGMNELQLWKRTSGASVYYELRVPLRKALPLSNLIYMNNIGLGACGADSLVTSFDRVNYDSLWAKY